MTYANFCNKISSYSNNCYSYLKNRALCLSHFYTIFNQHISIIYYVYNTNQNFSARLVRDKYEVSGWLVRDKHVIFGPTSGHVTAVVTPANICSAIRAMTARKKGAAPVPTQRPFILP